MPLLTILSRWAAIVLVAGFAVITCWKLLSGGFRLDGLLRAHDGTFSAGRAQLLVLTIFTAVQYLLQTAQDPSRFPAVPSIFLMALGGSQAAYLGSKAWSMFFGQKQPGQEEK